MKFSKELLSWYYLNKRDLPWRRTKDPYLVWLSEVIMQQTRIDQGTPYYERFVAAFPEIKKLAAAEEQDVLKLWQGLGYYSRARNLHATARTIVELYDDTFPDSYTAIRQLKGVGDYTAAAIASICYDLPHAVLDGNVMRFISRFFGIVESTDSPEIKKKILDLATQHIDHRVPGDFNQAMMEFGAIVCTPSGPECENCIFSEKCWAFHNKKVAEIPKRNLKPRIHDRFIHYLVLTAGDRGKEIIYLNKRTGNDIWKNMYDFPYVEHSGDKKNKMRPPDELLSLMKPVIPEFREVSGEYVHLLTHQKLHVRFYRFHSGSAMDLAYKAVQLKDLHQYPVPKLIDRYLSENILEEKCGK